MSATITAPAHLLNQQVLLTIADGPAAALTLREFFEQNGDAGLDAEAIASQLQAGETCTGGGGAEPDWTLKPRAALPVSLDRIFGQPGTALHASWLLAFRHGGF